MYLCVIEFLIDSYMYIYCKKLFAQQQVNCIDFAMYTHCMYVAYTCTIQCLNLSIVVHLCMSRLEVSELESKLTVARKEYQSFVTEDGSTAVSALPEFAINDSFTLNQDEAWYTLTIETRVMRFIMFM